MDETERIRTMSRACAAYIRENRLGKVRSLDAAFGDSDERQYAGVSEDAARRRKAKRA